MIIPTLLHSCSEFVSIDMRHSSPEQLCSRLTYPLAWPSVLTNCHSDCQMLHASQPYKGKVLKMYVQECKEFKCAFFVKSTFHMQ